MLRQLCTLSGKMRKSMVSMPNMDNLVIFEDNHIIAMYKPNKILSQSDITEDEDMLSMTKSYLKQKYHKLGNVFLGLVHRLDRPCSGVILFAKTSKAAERLSEIFRERKVIKKYIALVEGDIKENGECIDYFSKIKSNSLVKKLHTNKSHLSDQLSTVYAQEARLKYNTGRKHQIRAQLSNIGHPILGDKKYGSKFELTSREILLHAFLVSFFHPVTNKQIILTAQVPNLWRERYGEEILTVTNKLIHDASASCRAPGEAMIYNYGHDRYEK